jgi:hypothetical protein
MTVGDLTSQHYGQIVVVKDRKIYLMEHRDSGTYRGRKRIVLVEKDFTGKFAHKECHYTANTPCLVIGPWR